MTSTRKIFAIAQPVFIVVAFALLALLLRSQWTELQSHPWHIRPGWLVASAAMIGIGWLVEIRMWQRLLELVGARLEYWRAVRIWFSSAIVRYVPGNIWQPLSMTMLGSASGIRPEATVMSLTLFQLIHILAVGPIAVLYLATWGRTSGFGYWIGSFAPWWSVAIAVPVAFFLARPQSMLALANALLTKIGRDPLTVGLTPRQLVGVLGISWVAWIFFAGGFSALAAAVTPDLAFQTTWPHLLAAYPIAFAIGFLSLVTPGGLIVRDGMLFLLMTPVVGKDSAIVIAIAMRVWELILDAFAATCAFAVPLIRRAR